MKYSAWCLDWVGCPYEPGGTEKLERRHPQGAGPLEGAGASKERNPPRCPPPALASQLPG